MVKQSYFTILVLSMVVGLVTAYSFLIIMAGSFEIITTFAPMLNTTAVTIALACGLLYSPLAYWSLRKKDLSISVPVLLVSLTLFNVLLKILEVPINISLYAIFIYWIVALLLVKFLWKNA